jgi:porphobilinogen synthase
MNDQTRRLRRLRRTPAIRALTSEVRLDPQRFVLPIFASDAVADEEPFAALPGHALWAPERTGVIAKEAARVGIPAVLVFGVPATKDARASRAYAADGPTQRAIGAIKAAAPDLAVFADTCLCSFTDTGHCGVVEGGEVANDATVDLLTRTASAQAEAGADVVAPSDMMDGRIAAIRQALDAGGHQAVSVLSYAAKFASAMYGPFRDIADCAPTFGDRRSYQIDPAAPRQGIASIRRDVAEGADMVMVKPALAYLDVIAQARATTDVPVAAYNVSGEYAMIKAASAQGSLDERAATLEVLTAIVRAGADFVITYHALEAARWLADDGA